MEYISTRAKNNRVSAAQAITHGISGEGGLFVPESLPALGQEELSALVEMDYQQRACKILSYFLTDFTPEELRCCVEGAYGGGKFGEKVAPISKLCPNLYMLELWHGPTCAFKDMALQLLPRLLTVSAAKTEPDKTTAILVATSGDTGKAALEGFQDVAGTKMLVFYPENGVSPMQKLQMTTQEGDNLGVCAIQGNFDDAQSGVKRIFTDPAVKAKLLEKGIIFSSANSINWGRLAPQIVYYFSAYCDMVADEEIYLGEPVNVAVPTGNFGNILAAYYAKKMGLPVKKFICASNANNVLTDFIATGVYNRNRDFFTTISPSMDILISSNLERLLFALSGEDDTLVDNLMADLSQKGSYVLPDTMREELKREFFGGCCSDKQTKKTISRIFEEYSYLCDPHTAVAVEVYSQYRRQTGDETKTILASTASPYKFASSVLEALGEPVEGDEFAQLERLSALSGMEVPAALGELGKKPVRFTGSCSKDEMEARVYEMLGV